MADEKGLCTTILSLRVLGLPKKVSCAQKPSRVQALGYAGWLTGSTAPGLGFSTLWGFGFWGLALQYF